MRVFEKINGIWKEQGKVSKNKVVVMNSPMGQEDLTAMNDDRWVLQQVVSERIEVGRDYYEPSKIFHEYRYHHYFVR